MDGKDENGKPVMYYEDGEFFLKHSCDEWIIGSYTDAQAFIKQLQELMEASHDRTA